MIILEVSTTTTPIVSNWTIIAALAAILSAISAFRSSRIAKRVFEITRQTYHDRQANFTLYLIDGYKKITTNIDKKKLLLFHITINNKSDSKSSYQAELEIEYIRTDNSVARVIVAHDENLQRLVTNTSLSVFQNDIRIEERNMISKWVIFLQPEIITKEYRIEKYTIIVTDNQGNSQSVNSIILKDLNYVQ